MRSCLFVGFFCVALVVAPTAIEAKMERTTQNAGETTARKDAPQDADQHAEVTPPQTSSRVPLWLLSHDKSKNEILKENYEANEKPALDRAIATYSLWLTVLTGFMGFTALCQLFLFGWQLRLMRESLADTKESADAARKSADAADIQARISKEAFTNLERPYLFVFGADRIRCDQTGRRFLVNYNVANYGKLPAIIEEAQIDFVIGDSTSVQLPPRLGDTHPLVASPILEAGEKRSNILAFVPNDMIRADVFPTNEFGYISGGDVVPVFNVSADHDVFFRAVIKYSGPFSSGHETACLWLVDYPEAGLLAPRGGSDYNYTK